MPCYSPLTAYKAKATNPEKLSIVFTRPKSWRGECLKLPCGQCIGCRLERSRQWAVRCMHEASLYEKNCFLTLTYDDEHLPYNKSLDKTHFQLFMKRLRKKYGQGIRYYHCGEYGDLLARPHYHALLFNHDFDDKKKFSENKGFPIYTSEQLSSLWTNGFSTIGELTFESAAYVARYVLKKKTGQAKESYGDRIPEYSTMSRGSKKIGTGGIGKGWYDKFKEDVFPLDRVIVRGHVTRPPRLYDNYYSVTNRSDFELLKIEREKKYGNNWVDDVLSDGRRIKVSDNSDVRLRVKEEVKTAEIKNLMRSLEKTI